MQTTHTISSTASLVATPKSVDGTRDTTRQNPTDPNVSVAFTSGTDKPSDTTRQNPTDPDIFVVPVAVASLPPDAIRHDSTDSNISAAPVITAPLLPENLPSDLTRQNPTNADIVRTTLAPRQSTAARMLVSGRKVQEVAEHLGVHRSTLSEWRAIPAFQAYQSALIEELHRTTRERLRAMGEDALETIYALTKSSNESVALRAATYLDKRINLLKRE